MVGREISHYKIIERLGQGGMGVVFKAHDVKLDRFVAIKLLPPSDTAADDLKSRFIQEAKTASAIDHPNIGTIYEIDETGDGELFIVMAFLEGETLRAIIKNGPLPLEAGCDYALQIAHGMAKAHARNIIHRDLKPANIIVTTDGILKIIDFGLAKLMGGMQLTQVGSTVGTLGYMAPEQVRGDDVGPSCDIWALGVIFYEMLAGLPPFRGEFDAAILYSIGNEEPPPLESYRQDIPDHVRGIVKALLEKDPTKRPATMDDVVRMLDDRSAVFQPSSRSITPRTPGRFVAALRKRWLYAAGLLLWTVVGLFIYSLLTPTVSHRISPGLEKSIAILPIRFSGDTASSFNVDGIAVDMKRYLAKYPGVKPVSNRSVKYFAEKSVSDSALFYELGVNLLIKTNIRLTTAGIVFDVAIITASNLEPAWERQYSYPRNELHLLPRDVVADVADVLGLDPASIPPTETTDRPDVYESYLQGLHHELRSDQANTKKAREYFANAVASDPDFIPALIGLAAAKLEEFVQGWNPSSNVLPEVENYCRTVVRLDSANSTAYAILGKMSDLSGRRAEGMAFLERSLALDPYNVLALSYLGQMYIFELGKPTKGLVLLETLHRVEPSDYLTTLSLGVAHAQMNDYDRAISVFRQADVLNPGHVWTLFNFGYAFEHLLRADSAESYYQRTLAADPSYSSAASQLAGLYVAQNRLRDADTILRTARPAAQNDPELLYLHGIVLKKLNRDDEARTLWRAGKTLAVNGLKEHPSRTDLLAYQALFSIRLGEKSDYRAIAEKIIGIDSIHEESILGIVRLYALLREKPALLHWFTMMKGMNKAEYDEAWLEHSVDLEFFRKDPDLLVLLDN